MGTGESAREQADPLTTEQQQVAGRYKKLEDLLLRSAELESAENPGRSALLQQAAQLGKQAQLADLLARAATRLDNAPAQLRRFLLRDRLEAQRSHIHSTALHILRLGTRNAMF